MYTILEGFGKFFIIWGFIFAIINSIGAIFIPEFREPKDYTFEITIALGCLMVLVSKLNDIHKTIEEIKEKIK